MRLNNYTSLPAGRISRVNKLRYFLLLGLLLGIVETSIAAPSYCPVISPIYVEQPLRIGTKFSPPFVMGQLSNLEGLSINLWQLIADCLELKPAQYEYIEYGTANELIDATQQGEIDLAIAALSITPAREIRVDFSHRYFEASLGTLVTDRDSGANFGQLLKRIFSSDLLKIFMGLISFMVIVAIFYWSTERKRGNPFFLEGPMKGFYKSLIWSALLVFRGLGDPFTLNTRIGQLLVLLLMFFGVTMISSLTAIITSSLTLQRLEPQITRVEDLDGKIIAVKNLSVAAEWANQQDEFVEELQTFPQLQRKFDEGTVEVFIHDREILQYLVTTKALVDVKLAPLSLQPQDYAIAFPENSALLEPVNRALLTILKEDIWKAHLDRYLGKN